MRGSKVAVFYDVNDNEQRMHYANFTMKSLIQCMARHDMPKQVIAVKRTNGRRMKPKKHVKWYQSWGFSHEL